MIKTMLGVSIPGDKNTIVLEKIQKNIREPEPFFHIASLNPEIMVLSQQDQSFKDYLNWAQIRILDGMGVYVAAQLRGYSPQGRYAGVDLMEKVLFMADDMGLRVALIGGKGKIAEKVADCQKKRFLNVEFIPLEGIQDISSPSKAEEDAIISIVADTKPHVLFVAFGSPSQELWLYRHKDRLKGITCMGVGGAFDFLSGSVTRAPYFVRKMGFEWLYRLIRQPWRIKRQTRLITFLVLVLREAILRKSV